MGTLRGPWMCETLTKWDHSPSLTSLLNSTSKALLKVNPMYGQTFAKWEQTSQFALFRSVFEFES